MWTPTTRRQHSRVGLRYETELTDAEWAVIAPLMPRPAPWGRPPLWTTREVLNASFYVLRGGISWRMIPKDLPPRSTTFGYGAYRCIGSDGHRFDGKPVCTNRPVRSDRLKRAVWTEVEAILNDPARVAHEYQQRLAAVSARVGSAADLGEAERRIATLRRGIGRLIDGYAEGVIERSEFEPRIADLRGSGGATGGAARGDPGCERSRARTDLDCWPVGALLRSRAREPQRSGLDGQARCSSSHGSAHRDR